ncbi:pyridoxamine 5'-phosphate oxidase family protein [Beduini massiliensis]|uniref:pyridoxamine 5'-phosphate oxidase family protein n=1 Tax=Beduini massiliensis TaxID=1585974 RepID=UPI00059A9A64|nr:pyridoxamine 5'-phosphate oxidase family protein [Beduini massiliensis]
MFREMRRKNQLLSIEETISILEGETSGTLAVLGDDGYPYAVPLSYVYKDSKIYFHCAKSGHKIEAILNNNKVSFCIIAQDQIIPEEYTTYYRSVIAFGKARLLENEEKHYAIDLLAKKYSPQDEAGRAKEIEESFNRVVMVEIAIEHMTGKAARELVRKEK